MCLTYSYFGRRSRPEFGSELCCYTIDLIESGRRTDGGRGQRHAGAERCHHEVTGSVDIVSDMRCRP